MATPTPFIIGEAIRRAAQWFKEHPAQWTRQSYAIDLGDNTPWTTRAYENLSEIPPWDHDHLCYCAAGRAGLELLRMGFPWRDEPSRSHDPRPSVVNLVEEQTKTMVPRPGHFLSDYNDAQTSHEPVIQWMEEAADKLQTDVVPR